MKNIIVILISVVICVIPLFAQSNTIAANDEIIAAPVDQPSNTSDDGQYPFWEINLALNFTTLFPCQLTYYLDTQYPPQADNYTAKGLEINTVIYPLSFLGLLVGYEFSSIIVANTAGYYPFSILRETLLRVGIVFRIIFAPPNFKDFFYMKLLFGVYLDSMWYHEKFGYSYPTGIGNGSFLGIDFCFAFGDINCGVGATFYTGFNDVYISGYLISSINRLKIPLYIGLIF